MEPRVFVINDNRDFLGMLTSIFNPVNLPIKSYSDSQEFLDNYPQSATGCILLDVSMPLMSGIELQAKLLELDSLLSIIFITKHSDVSIAVKAIKMGAVDFFELPFNNHQLVESVLKGVRISNNNLKLQQKKNNKKQKLELLTKRETEVFQLLVKGLKNKEMSELLSLKVRTIESHRGNIVNKLNVSNLAGLIEIDTA